MRAPTYPPPPPARKRRKRKSLLLSFLGFGFAAAVVVFVVASAGAGYMLWKYSKDLPDYDSLAKYEPPVMTRIHAHNGALIAEFARERRIFVPINTIPKRVLAAFLSAEDRRFYDHGGVDFQGIARAVYKLIEAKIQGKSRRAEGASTITQQVAKNFLLTQRALGRAQDQGGDPRHPHRARLLQGQDPRALPQRDLPRHRRLRRRRGEPQLLQQGAAGSDDRGGGLPRGAAEGAQQLSPVPPDQGGAHPPQLDHRADARERLHHQGGGGGRQGEAARRELPPVGAHIFAAEYFAEEVRRTLLSTYGEEKLYSGGLSVRTTLDPRLQQIARTALIDGLVEFDRRKGWRGPVKKIDISADWGAALDKVESPGDIQPWRLGVVLKTEASQGDRGLAPGEAAGRRPRQQARSGRDRLRRDQVGEVRHHEGGAEGGARRAGAGRRDLRRAQEGQRDHRASGR